MNHNVHLFCKLIFSNKFGFILETVFSYKAPIRTFKDCTWMKM